ncbi:retrotransposon protein, putative, ty1-copia subclass [Tanacetum coccineum]
MEYSFYNPSENKVFVARNAEFFENDLIDLKASGSVEDLELIQEEDTNPSEHELGDLGEPANYKAALLDPESKKWLDAMNVEIAIRILIAIAAYYDYEIWQMDVKTAFLNGHLSEEVYMEQPEGFVNPKYPNHVCKLKRSIYGLKQASRQWNKRFDDEIKKFDVKSYLGKCFAIKDLGDASIKLGIKIYHDRSKRLIGLNQSTYIEKILKRFYMENSKRGTIPMQEKLKLSKSQGASTPAEKQRMQNIPYASAIGSIMYVVRCTRPDVAFAQNMTSRFQQNPGEEHTGLRKKYVLSNLAILRYVSRIWSNMKQAQ